MRTIPAFEAKTKFGQLLDRVEAGEEIVITRHERPVARIIPEAGPSLEQARRAAEGLEVLQREIADFCAGKPAVSWSDFKSFVEEDRA